MDRRATGLIDRGQVRLDGVGDHIARMQPDPHMKFRVVQKPDAADHFDRRMASHHGMVVVGLRRAEQRDQAVAALLADDAAVAADGRPHRNKRRLEPGNRLFRIEIRDQVGRTLEVDAENGKVFSLAGDAAANLGGRGARCRGRAIRNRRPAG